MDIPGGAALVGTATQFIPVDEEGPVRRKTLKPFQLAQTTVTNAAFERFVRDTGYRTEAERFGWSFVFHSQVPEQYGATQALAEAQWWRRVDGATWRDVHGPDTQAEHWRADHPVVHVSWNDARRYAAWVGGRLPTEAEWEHAARGGLGDVPFPWGTQEPNDTNALPCNIWQGQFPDLNTAMDGYETTAPARSFARNGYGLYNMVGNVWQWTADPFRLRSNRMAARLRQASLKGYKIVKGGSFLCHKSYCNRYRIAARTGNSPDSTTSHTGFRVAWDRPGDS
jgi:formylglycine-generating enzyme required for sulfatase activity